MDNVVDSRSEFIFISGCKYCNPNGDPANDNCPRYDEEHALISDVRIKRTARDEMAAMGYKIFIDGRTQTLTKRLYELASELYGDEFFNRTKIVKDKSGKEKTEKVKLNREEAKEILSHCLDYILFGGTISSTGDSNVEKFSYCRKGPVQLSFMGTSLNRCPMPMSIKGTGAFSTSDDNDQRTFRREYVIPFALIAAYGVVDPFGCQDDHVPLTEEHIETLYKAIWNGTGNLSSRSKFGQLPVFFCSVKYKSDYRGPIIGTLNEKLRLLAPDGEPLTEEQENSLREYRDFKVDFSDFSKTVLRRADVIDSVYIKHNPDLETCGLDKMIEDLESAGIKVTYERD